MLENQRSKSGTGTHWGNSICGTERSEKRTTRKDRLKIFKLFGARDSVCCLLQSSSSWTGRNDSRTSLVELELHGEYSTSTSTVLGTSTRFSGPGDSARWPVVSVCVSVSILDMPHDAYHQRRPHSRFPACTNRPPKLPPPPPSLLTTTIAFVGLL